MGGVGDLDGEISHLVAGRVCLHDPAIGRLDDDEIALVAGELGSVRTSERDVVDADEGEGGVAIAEAPVGEGKLLLMGSEITFRAQPHGTFKLLFNSLYLGTAKTAN